MNNIEIERKFLVIGEFHNTATGKTRIVQGYLSTEPDRIVRVRMKGEQGFLTVKGPSNSNGFAHAEFEYPIPAADAEAMLALCPSIIEKDRYFVPHAGHIFEVDVFHGRHEGLVVAELELEQENQPFELPPWAGEEVTGREQYYNAWLSENSTVN
jgi:CYTH domain-containing protein